MGNPLSCVIIGDGAVAVACADMLLEHGHAILALVSSDRRTLRWAELHGVALSPTLAALDTILEGRPFDYLLSIVNLRKLPDSLLLAPRRMAINFHDAPLPRYAGSNATSWALLNGEAGHAVTWHVMTRWIDAGDILVQVPVGIDPEDTAFTLNAHCHEAAVDGFRELLAMMEADALQPRPQDLSRRTFFARSRRPSPGCVLPFERAAEDVYAMWRALEFGPALNALGLPRVAIGDGFAIVTEVELLERASTADAGTIVGIAGDGLEIATATSDVFVGGFFTLEAEPLTVGQVVDWGALQPGQRMPSLTSTRAVELEALEAQWSRHEAFWLTRLSQSRPLVLPFASKAEVGRMAQLDQPVAADLGALAAGTGLTGGEALLAAVLCQLADVCGTDSAAIGLAEQGMRAEIGDLHGYFASWLPLPMRIESPAGFREVAKVLRRRLERMRARGSYVRDLPVRDPALRSRLGTVVPAAWPVGVELVDDLAAAARPVSSGRLLTARIRHDGRAIRWAFDADAVPRAWIEDLSQRVTRFVQHLPAVAAPARSAPRSEPVHRWDDAALD